jgi:hypothetical protein
MTSSKPVPTCCAVPHEPCRWMLWTCSGVLQHKACENFENPAEILDNGPSVMAVPSVPKVTMGAEKISEQIWSALFRTTDIAETRHVKKTLLISDLRHLIYPRVDLLCCNAKSVGLVSYPVGPWEIACLKRNCYSLPCDAGSRPPSTAEFLNNRMTAVVTWRISKPAK